MGTSVAVEVVKLVTLIMSLDCVEFGVLEGSDELLPEVPLTCVIEEKNEDDDIPDELMFV